jgi:hypothetical protein
MVPNVFWFLGLGFVVKGGITTPPMKHNYLSYAPKIQFLEQPPVRRICGVPENGCFYW